MEKGHGINQALANVRAMAFVACALVAPLVGATPVVLDFNSAAPAQLLTADYFEDGFRIRPLTCHYDIVEGTFATSGDGTNWMGFDRAGCDFDPSAILRIDRPGDVFDLVSLEVVEQGWTSILGSNGATIEGCVDPVGTCEGLLSFGAAEWSGLTFVDFFSSDDPGAPVGFDNVVFDVAVVSAPATLLLFLTATAGLFGSRSLTAHRRRRSMSSALAA